MLMSPKFPSLFGLLISFLKILHGQATLLKPIIISNPDKVKNNEAELGRDIVFTPFKS